MEKKRNIFTRRMDDLGNVNIPKEIQSALGLKATELPEFSISLGEDGKSIRMVPLTSEQIKGFVIEEEIATPEGTIKCKGYWE